MAIAVARPAANTQHHERHVTADPAGLRRAADAANAPGDAAPLPFTAPSTTYLSCKPAIQRQPRRSTPADVHDAVDDVPIERTRRSRDEPACTPPTNTVLYSSSKYIRR